MRAFQAGRIPRSRRREKRVPSVEPFGMERYRPQDRLDRSRRSIQLPYVTQRTSARSKGDVPVPLGSPRHFAVPVLSADRSDWIPRKRGPAARTSSGCPTGSLGIAHRFQCAPATIFSVHNYVAVCCVDIRQTFLTAHDSTSLIKW